MIGFNPVRVQHLAEVVNGYPFDSERFDTSNGYPLLRIRDVGADVTETRYTGEFVEAARVVPGDVVVGMDGDFKVGQWLGAEDALLNQRVALLRTDAITARFLLYALPQELEAINAVTYATTVKHLSASQIMHTTVSWPGIEGASAIADFLDRETAKIDALLAKQEELGRAVREHLHGVQDGLVSLSEGGVRFKYLVDEVDFRAGAEWERLPLLSVSIHWGVRRRDEVTDDLPRAEDLSNYKVVESGDIVVNRMRAFQGALGRSPIDGIVSPDYLVLRAAANVRSDWLAAAMRTPEFISEMAARVRGIGSAELGTVRTPRINADELGEIRLDVPTPPEQEARYVTRLSSESQAAVLLERIGSLTDALKERRAALITAAVTGKLDVSTYGKAG